VDENSCPKGSEQSPWILRKNSTTRVRFPDPGGHRARGQILPPALERDEAGTTCLIPGPPPDGRGFRLQPCPEGGRNLGHRRWPVAPPGLGDGEDRHSPPVSGTHGARCS